MSHAWARALGLDFRPARDADSAGVIALVAACYAEYPGCVLLVDEEEPELRQPASTPVFDGFWVLAARGDILGTIAWKAYPEHLELKKLYLAPTLRGQGLARHLVAHVEAEARRRGLGRVELWSDTRFETAHRVYAHLGYAASGTRRALQDASQTEEDHYFRALD